MDKQHNEGKTEFEQDFKELNIYLDVLCKNGHEVKDAGHTWIVFSDKFRNFKERILAAIPDDTGIKKIAAAYDAGWARGHSEGADIENFTNHPNKEQYLSTIK